MKFTNEVPTVDGYYLWRFDLSFIPYVVLIQNGYTEAGNLPQEMSGEWCRLVPEDEIVPKEEVEKAFIEGMFADGRDLKPDLYWKHSRAKRVMEGAL